MWLQNYKKSLIRPFFAAEKQCRKAETGLPRADAVQAGTLPKRLAEGSEGVQQSTMNHIQPTRGMRVINIQPPPRPMSCIRRTATASDGIISASETRVDMTDQNTDGLPLNPPVRPSINPSTQPIRKLKSTKYQYWLREARPEKLAYWLNTLEMDCEKVISYILSEIFRQYSLITHGNGNLRLPPDNLRARCELIRYGER